MPDIRNAIRTLFGQGATHQQIQTELDNLQIEQLLDRLSREGHLAADPHIRQLAEQLARHNPHALEQLLTHPRPAPAATTRYTPPTTHHDPTEEAIQQHMQQHNQPYAEAAAQIITHIHTGE